MSTSLDAGTRPWVRRALMVSFVLVLAAGMMLPRFGKSARAELAPLSAPTAVTVARTGPTLGDLRIGWAPVFGVDHYTVSVFDGATDASTVVPADTSALVVTGSGACARYRVRVSAVSASGVVATSRPVLLASQAPGGIVKLAVSRSESGTSGTLTWAAPANPGLGDPPTYRLRMTDMVSGKTVLDEVVKQPSYRAGELDARRQYSVRLAAQNSFGTCITASTILYGPHPSPPRSVTVQRDSSTPSRVLVAWSPPAWSGYGPVTGYQVGYLKDKTRVWVAAKSSPAVLTLSAAVDQNIAVRAVSSDDIGVRSDMTVLAKAGGSGSVVTDPRITVTEASGTVTVTTSAAVGSTSTYPKLMIRVAPTLVSAGFTDSQLVANGATTATFATLPCGVHTVVVTGYGAGVEKEFGRSVINRCNTGALSANLWKVVYGSATIRGNTVDVTSAGERRIMSVTKHVGADMVLTTTAHLHTGWGFGIFARADTSAGGASVSGYSMQYDPGYANVSSFGKALLLRLWSKGSECGTPLAKVPFPAGVEVYAPHRFMVVVKGDTLFATIDDKVVFNVASLAAAVKANGCGLPVPTGTEIGFRTWNQTTATFTDTTLN